MAATDALETRVEQFCPRCHERYTHESEVEAYDVCLDCGTKLTAPAPITEVSA